MTTLTPSAARHPQTQASAVAHAASLFGQPLPPGTDLSTWWTIGGQHATRD